MNLLEKNKLLKNFLKFSLIWYSQQFAIPFWVVGHVHLHLTTYQDWVELLCSILLHLSVLAGFLLDWVNYNKNQN